MTDSGRIPRGIHRLQIAPMLDVSYQDFRYVKRSVPQYYSQSLLTTAD